MGLKLEDYMDWPKIEDLEYAECTDPRDVLGPVEVKGNVLVRGYFPDAEKVSAVVKGKSRPVAMTKMDQSGYFAAFLGGKKIPEYTFRVETEEGNIEICDAYAVDDFVDAMDEAMFESGTHDTIYEKLGAHARTVNGRKGTNFAVWAPNAVSVSVVGDFNGWDGRKHPMRRHATGIFELFVEQTAAGDL